mgnify:CR=1 FL=1
MKIPKGRRICIICEGNEEKDYMSALINKQVFSDNYCFVEPINAKSINNIFNRYTDRYQSNSYDLVLVFCDTDKGPSDKYKEIKQKINEFHGNKVADNIVIFGNPCTMQIILAHFAEIKLTSQSKSVNSKYIEKYTGIVNYKANEEQRKELFGKINRRNYENMKKNVAKLSTDDNITSSTNILKFIEKFEKDDDSWIDEINSEL